MCMDYYIRIGEVCVPVSEEIYKAYCQGARKERYFREGDRRNRTLFYDALDTEELKGSEMFSDPDATSVEEAAEKNCLLEALKGEVEKLNRNEKELLCRLYVYGDSLRALAREKHIPVTTLQSRHKKLLERLKKKLE